MTCVSRIRSGYVLLFVLAALFAGCYKKVGDVRLPDYNGVSVNFSASANDVRKGYHH